MRSSGAGSQCAAAAADPEVLAKITAPLRPSAALQGRITNQLSILAANQRLAAGGSLATLIAEKDAAREALIAIIGRIRQFYCSCSDDREYNPELARSGFQVKRDPGEAQPAPAPEAMGAITFDAATRELVATARPAHASFLRAYRQVAGAEPELAGISEDLRVGVTQHAPAQPGVTYTAWLVGVNSRGEGEPSNKVTFVG